MALYYMYISLFIENVCVPTFLLRFLGGLVVSRFVIKSQAVTSVWVQLPAVAMVWACLNLTLAVEQDIRPKL